MPTLYIPFSLFSRVATRLAGRLDAHFGKGNIDGRVRLCSSHRWRMKFGVLTHKNSANIGDFIQSVAARNLLPSVDTYIDRDLLLATSFSEVEVAAIISGWFSHKPENWPPAGNIVPLLTSMHISEHTSRISSPAKLFLGESAEYMRQWSPVGARDLRTLELLQSAGVESYFSGCLTLTLQSKPDATRSDVIICTDVPTNVLAFIRRKTTRPILCLTHYEPHLDEDKALSRAEELIERYGAAHCVVTTRLHCALPCLALGTPVLFLDVVGDDPRLRGLNMLFRHCSVEDFVQQTCPFDLNDPAPNELDYLRYRNQLIYSVNGFVSNVQSGIIVPKPDRSFELRFNSLWASHLKTVQELREALDAKSDDITQLRETLALKTQEMWDLQTALATGEKTAVQLRAMLDVKMDEIAQLQHAVATALREGAQLRDMLVVKTNEIAHLHTVIEAGRTENAQLREILDRKDGRKWYDLASWLRLGRPRGSG